MSMEVSSPEEIQRLAALYQLGMLDTAPEARFDEVTRFAQSLFNVPISLISLIDEDRQWFKSKQGLELNSTKRSVAFCSHTVGQDELFLVPDASVDARFKDNQLVTGPPDIRFYAGYPLKSPDGFNVGTLCVIDTKARTMTDLQCDLLRMLGKLVELELNREFEQALIEDLHFKKYSAQLITSWQADFIGQRHSDSMFDSILHDLIELTRGEYGFIGEVLKDEEQNPYLKMRAITDISWNAKTHELYQQSVKSGMEFRNLDSLVGYAIVSQKLLITNDAVNDPRSAGVLPGHPTLRRFVGIPVHADGEIVALIGLANRPVDYTSEFVHSLEPLVGTIGLLIASRRLYSQEKKAYFLLDQVSAHVPGMIYQFKRDKNGKLSFPYASSGIRSLYKVEPGDVINDADAVWNIIHPDDVEGLRRSVELSASLLKNWNHEYRTKDDSGNERWLSGHAAPKLEDDGSVIWHGYITDVTERRLASEKIGTAAKVFSNAVESILITDANGNISDVNPSFERTTGYKRTEVLGLTPSILSSGRHDRTFYRKLWSTLLANGIWTVVV